MTDIINIKQIRYGSVMYDEMVQLRHELLRAPIGLTFAKKDLEKDKKDYLLGAYLAVNNNIVGCCILTPFTSDTVQLRQMAISENYQRTGIGSKLIMYAEEMAKHKGYNYIYLHSRKVAIDFYLRHGYKTKRKEFIEVGIPHYEMTKKLN